MEHNSSIMGSFSRRKNKTFQVMVSERHKNIFWHSRPSQVPGARSMITGIFQVFSGSMSYTGFCTGYNSRVPGENEVNGGSSHKLPME